MIEFSRYCPNCSSQTGFSLEPSDIKHNDKYLCEECGKEFRLSQFTEFPNKIPKPKEYE